jgi:nitroreductase
MEIEDEIYINGYKHLRYQPADEPLTEEIVTTSQSIYRQMSSRRSVRDFSDRPVSKQVIENLLLAAGTAPSGANKQPWTFCAVSSPEIKKQIRKAAEEEERKAYDSKMPPDWLKDLAPLGTNWEKPFLEIAPWLIIVFKKSYDLDENGNKRNNYYVQESTGLACGFLIQSIHRCGLVTLTHTPSPMNFLSKILQRPENEKPFLLLPVGYPAYITYVPDIHRKCINQTTVWFE